MPLLPLDAPPPTGRPSSQPEEVTWTSTSGDRMVLGPACETETPAGGAAGEACPLCAPWPQRAWRF